MPQHKVVVADFCFWIHFQWSVSKCQGRSGGNLKKRQRGHSRSDFLMRVLGMKEVMQRAYG
jgi:hypothetical protein